MNAKSLFSLEAWSYGLVRAAITGTSSTVVLMIGDPLHFNLHEWHELIKVAIVSGGFSAFCYLQKSPLPDFDNPMFKIQQTEVQKPLAPLQKLPLPCFIVGLLSMLLMTGCVTTDSNISPEQVAENSAKWVDDKSALIEDATAAITRAAIFSFAKDSSERSHVTDIVHTISANLNAAVAGGTVDPDQIRNVLKIEEPYIGGFISAFSSLFESYLDLFNKNGYGHMSLSIVKALSAGAEEGTR